MRSSLSGPMMVCVLIATIATLAAADDAQDKAIAKDRKQIEGVWRIVSLEIDGNKSPDDDIKKLSVVNGSDGTWRLRSEGVEISKGTSSFDPSKKPKTIEFKTTEGEAKGNQYLGIYELGEKSRKLCFAQPGRERPTEFASAPGSEQILVLFERESAP